MTIQQFHSKAKEISATESFVEVEAKMTYTGSTKFRVYISGHDLPEWSDSPEKALRLMHNVVNSIKNEMVDMEISTDLQTGAPFDEQGTMGNFPADELVIIPTGDMWIEERAEEIDVHQQIIDDLALDFDNPIPEQAVSDEQASVDKEAISHVLHLDEGNLENAKIEYFSVDTDNHNGEKDITYTETFGDTPLAEQLDGE